MGLFRTHLGGYWPNNLPMISTPFLSIRVLLLSLLLLAFLTPAFEARADFMCSGLGNSIYCNDMSLPPVPKPEPFKLPDYTSQIDTLKAQYGLTNYYSCVRSSGYLNKSGGPDSGTSFIVLKHCMEQQAMLEEARQRQQAQTPTCPTGTYAQNGVCIQPVVQQQVAALAPVQSHAEACKSDYGPFSTWTGELNDSGGPSCTCVEGYGWQGGVCAPTPNAVPVYVAPEACPAGTTYDGTSCKTHEDRCKADFGRGGTWDGSLNENGGPVCGCVLGFEWSESEWTCRPIENPKANLFSAFAPMDRENSFLPKADVKTDAAEESVDNRSFFEVALQVIRAMSLLAP